MLSGDAFLLGERSTDGQMVTERLFRTCTRFEKATHAVMVMGHLCDAALGLRALYKVRYSASMLHPRMIDFTPVLWPESASGKEIVVEEASVGLIIKLHQKTVLMDFKGKWNV